ncbi:MAG: ArsR/SmtB family transcription factor [Acidimicrobiales bacterium]
MAPPDGRRLDLAVRTFALLADPTRLKIVWHLRNTELSVNEIAARVEKSPATVSQHLGKLRLAAVVRSRRDGNFIHYTLADNHIGEVVEDALYHAEHLDPPASGGCPG